MKNEYLTIGYITAPHGLKGGLRIKPATTFINERFQKGNILYVQGENNSEMRTLTIKTVHENKGLLVVTFQELNSIEEAEALLKLPLVILKKSVKLDEGYFLFDDLLGMQVVLEDKTLVGEVSEILEYASYFTLRIKRKEGRDLLIPYIEQFIVSTDLAHKTIIFRPIEGML